MDGLANLTTNFRLKPLIVLDDKVQKFQLKSVTLMSYCYSREQTNKIKYSIVHSTIGISPVLDDCRQLASRFQQIQFNHCYRQENWCADMLARIGAEQESDFILFSSPPVDLFKALEDDCNGVYFNRLCTDLDVVA